MSIDEITIRSQIIVKTYAILKEQGIKAHGVFDEFQERYMKYNMDKFGMLSLKYHPDRDDLVIQREKDLAIRILEEKGIENAKKYFN